MRFSGSTPAFPTRRGGERFLAAGLPAASCENSREQREGAPTGQSHDRSRCPPPWSVVDDTSSWPVAACAATPDRVSGATGSGMGSTCFSARSTALGLAMSRPKVMDAPTENSSRSSAMTGPRRSARSVLRHRSDPIGRRSAPLRGRSDAPTRKPAQRGPVADGQLPSGESRGRTPPSAKRSEAGSKLRSGARVRIGRGGSRLSAPSAFAISRKG